MAGCRPDYMPVLIALVEAMADPYYGVEHSGNTPGGETLIVLRQNLEMSAAGALRERGRPVRLAWRALDASLLDTTQEEEAN